ncbi:MAG: ATP-dependent metallopeptidase FtsH/Yme1/Tma family protein, partial [Firmicutes bacterium]|nr:ATP-dependent metallopeptidase FtsH/Yme1/Tma family protein [Bacillota bacterium]
MKNRGKGPKGIAFYALVLLAAFVLAYSLQSMTGALTAQTVNLEFSEFVADLQNGKVASVKVSEGSRSYEGQLKDGTQYIAYAPSDYDMLAFSENYIVPMAANGELTVYSVK